MHQHPGEVVRQRVLLRRSADSIEVADANTIAAAANPEVAAPFGSFTRPNAASTAIAPSAQVNQCEAAASGTGMPTPAVTQTA